MKGETKRYLRTNSNKLTLDKMKLHLAHKLKHRGYKKKKSSTKSKTYSSENTHKLSDEKQNIHYKDGIQYPTL